MILAGEKDFYLEEFRQRTLVLSIEAAALARVAARRRFAAVVAELVENQTRVVVVLGGEGGDPSEVRDWLQLPRRARARRSALGGRAPRQDALVWDPATPEAGMQRIWQVLRGRDLCLVLTPDSGRDVAGLVASRSRALKLVLLDEAGGLQENSAGQVLSYLDGARLEVLLGPGEAEFQGLGSRRADLEVIGRMLDAGVGSVNLCRAGDLAQELFSYEGAGTFFSQDDHLTIGRLSIDDFSEVERLLARGQAEGLLKPRTAAEAGELLLDGYGAWIGEHHLAGVGALRRNLYADVRAAEIAGLYAITRFKGEGIGKKLVRRMIQDGRADGLSFVFSVTSAERAATFFLGEGFKEVSPEDLPSAKWEGYAPERRRRVRAFRLDLPD